MINKKLDADKSNNQSNTNQNLSQHLSKEPTFSPKLLNNDDLILSLADEYENKRARQVIEWERVQRKHLTQTA